MVSYRATRCGDSVDFHPFWRINFYQLSQLLHLLYEHYVQNPYLNARLRNALIWPFNFADRKPWYIAYCILHIVISTVQLHQTQYSTDDMGDLYLAVILIDRFSGYTTLEYR